MKRFIDLVLAFIGLIVATPIMLLIALAIRLEGTGEIIFSQKRLGKNHKPFMVHKFRKFPANWGTAGPGVTVAGDMRMTKIGRILERTKFDELPQLWNIIKGDMSFVGPRPESMRYADMFTGQFAEVLDYLPGIFGPNQIAYRNESEMYPADIDPEKFYRESLFPAKARNDIDYFQQANVLSDISWMFKGVMVSLVGVINWQRLLGFHGKILFLDLLVIEATWAIVIFFKTFGWLSNPWLDNSLLIDGLYILPLILMPILFFGGCYRHPVRYFVFEDAVRLIIVASIAWISAMLIIMGIVERNMSFMIVPIGWLLLIPLLALPRVIGRLQWEKQHPKEQRNLINIAIYGIGKAGIPLANWLKHSGTSGLHLLGFIDDAKEMHGTTIASYRVLGRESDIPTLKNVHHVNEIWMTFVPANEKYIRLQEVCEDNDIKLVILPECEPFSRFI